MWTYALLTSLFKACRIEYSKLKETLTNWQDSNATGDTWYDTDYPLEGSETTAKLNMRIAEDFVHLTNTFEPGTYETSAGTNSGLYKYGRYSDNYADYGPPQYTIERASNSSPWVLYDLTTDAGYAAFIAGGHAVYDASGFTIDILTWAVRNAKADLWRLTSGKQGNTVVEGNSTLLQ